MGAFRDKAQRFFKSRGWHIFWSLCLIVLFIDFYVDHLHGTMTWSRVALLVSIALITIAKVIELVWTLKSGAKDD